MVTQEVGEAPLVWIAFSSSLKPPCIKQTHKHKEEITEKNILNKSHQIHHNQDYNVQVLTIIYHTQNLKNRKRHHKKYEKDVANGQSPAHVWITYTPFSLSCFSLLFLCWGWEGTAFIPPPLIIIY